MNERALRLPASISARRWVPYAGALAGVAVMTLLRLPFEGLLQGQAPYILYILPILASAWLFGVGPTVLAAVASLVAAWYIFIPPAWSFALPTGRAQASVALFSLVAGAVIWLARGAASSRQAALDSLAVSVRAERALVEQRERFRVTLASIGDAVITTDREGRVTFLNPPAQTLTGWTAAEALGQPLEQVFRLVDEDSRQPVTSASEKVLRTPPGVGLTNHTALLSRDGSEHPIADSAAPILDDQKVVWGAVHVFRDISSERLGALEQQAAERDREQLLESERAARTEAERATRLKDEFVATLSHELRTPLNAILGWTQLLRRNSDRDPSSLARGLEVIERNTRLQAQLISDLLDVSRIVSGKLRLELELVDLAAVIEAAVETVRAAAEPKGVEIRRVIDPAVPALVGDHARLQQIVWNLLSNAIKFSDQGGVVSVTLARQDVAAVLTVSDHGVGIKPEFVPFLFDRFRQADGSTSRRFGGLGLGLAIVKQLTELHNGIVSVESGGEGQGATFTVRLPLGVAREESPAERTAGGRGPLGTDAARQLEGITVLVVEDDEDTRELVNRLLAECGARVLTASSAASALERFEADSPDILISDIGLPGEDGYSLITRIRNLDGAGGSRVPAIALTAFARSEDRTRALQAGFQAHLAKPVEPVELVATVASFASMLRSRGQPV
jgi:PAS domain S-box-containing protein